MSVISGVNLIYIRTEFRVCIREPNDIFDEKSRGKVSHASAL
jgi:hypothetical protein